MEEAYWQQFMNTGRIEDYLQSKGVFNPCDECWNEKEEEASKNLERRRQLKEKDKLS